MVNTGYIVGRDKTPSGVSYRVILCGYINNKWEINRAEVNEQNLVASVSRGKLKLLNAALEGKKLKGTTGSLDRFDIDKNSGIRPVVMISEIKTDEVTPRIVGYRVADYNGKVTAIKTADLLDYCKNIIDQSTKSTGKAAAPIQNAMYISQVGTVKAHISKFKEDQVQVEIVHIGKPKNVTPAQVDSKENNRQASRLEEIFTKEQIKELLIGRDHGVNYKLYANKEFTPEQMRELRKAMENGVNPRLFADPAFPAKSMKAYRIQMKYGVNVASFINPRYTPEQIIEISTGLIAGIDISKIADPNKSVNEMAEERISLEGEIWKEDRAVLLDLIK